MPSFFVRLFQSFSDLKMKKKVAVTYLVLGVLLTVSLSLFTHFFIRGVLIDNETKLITDTVNQSAMQISYQFSIFEALSNYIFNDTELLRIINYTYGDSYFSMWLAYRDHIIPTFQAYTALHPDLVALTIFTGSDLHRYGNFVLQLSALTDLPWYTGIEGSFMPVWLVVENEENYTLISIRRMPTQGLDGKINYLFMEFDYNSFLRL